MFLTLLCCCSPGSGRGGVGAGGSFPGSLRYLWRISPTCVSILAVGAAVVLSPPVVYLATRYTSRTQSIFLAHCSFSSQLQTSPTPSCLQLGTDPCLLLCRAIAKVQLFIFCSSFFHKNRIHYFSFLLIISLSHKELAAHMTSCPDALKFSQ